MIKLSHHRCCRGPPPAAALHLSLWNCHLRYVLHHGRVLIKLSDSNGETDNPDDKDEVENEMDVDDDDEIDPQGDPMASTCNVNSSTANLEDEKEADVELSQSNLGQENLIDDSVTVFVIPTDKYLLEIITTNRLQKMQQAILRLPKH